MIKGLLISILVLLSSSLAAIAQRKVDTFRVYFDLNIDVLDNKAKTYLDSLNYQNILVPGKAMSIIGYTDYLATEDYNQSLSERRANTVRSYLESFGVKRDDIQILIGKGEQLSTQSSAADGVREDRKVEIVMGHIGRERALHTRYIGADTAIRMQPWKKKEIPPSSSDPNFDINKIEVGRTFILKNIYFPMGRHFPRQESFPELDKLLETLKEYIKIRIQIEGHICCVDNMPDAYDLDTRQMDLSVNRARFVYEYLLARGINKSRLGFIGFGKSRPIIADEQTEEEASINRRVEIRLLEK